MGHYEEIKISCNLSELGLDILKDLNEEGSWLELSKRHPEYAFLEIASNMADRGMVSSHNQKLLCGMMTNDSKNFEYSTYSKIDENKFRLLRFVLPFLAESEISFYYWNEFYDSCDRPFEPRKPDQFVLYPKTPTIDWYRKFGDSTAKYEVL
jgi:hypothetical protein